MRLVYLYPWGSFYPVRSGSARVVCNHLHYFHSRGWEVDCIFALAADARAASMPALREEFAWLRSLTAVDPPRLSRTFRETILYYDEYRNAKDLCRDLADGADAFFANYVFTAPLLRNIPAACRRILESHDLLTRMFANIGSRIGYAPVNCNASIIDAKNVRHMEIEMDLYRLYDAVVMISEEELHTAQSYGATNAHFVPQMFPVAAHTAPREYEFDLLFVGSENTFNVQGIDWFYRKVYVPYLWKHGVRMAVVGKVGERLDWEDPLVTKMTVDDAGLDRVYQTSKVVIAPIFDGTGSAVKTLEGLAKGGVIVATPVAARGIKALDEVLVCIDMAADPQSTAQRILELLAAPDARRQLQRSALAFMEKGFSRDAYYTAMDRVFEAAGVACRPAKKPVTSASSPAA